MSGCGRIVYQGLKRLAPFYNRRCRLLRTGVVKLRRMKGGTVRVKRILIFGAAFLVILGVSLASYHWETRAASTCQICGRMIPKETAFQLDTPNGTIEACCPSCAMHFILSHPNFVRSAKATDFTTGRKISALSAYYDEGGDVQYCTLNRPPVKRGPIGVRERVYDRCLPVLVAFANHDDAEAYRKQHGGRVLTYNQALASLRAQ